MSIIYLACPYTDGTPEIRLARFNAVTHVAAQLIEQKRIVFSPLTMTHPIDLVLNEDGATLGSDYWVSFDEAFMEFCTEIYVLTLPGWEKSRGVKREIAFLRAEELTRYFCLLKNTIFQKTIRFLLLPLKSSDRA